MEIVKTILKSIWDFTVRAFHWTFSDWKNTVIVFSLIALGLLYVDYRNVRYGYENELRNAGDSLTVYRNKAGELYMQKAACITDIKTLRKERSELYDEIRNLRDNPVIVTKFETVTEYSEKILHDTVTVSGNGKYTTGISYSDEWTRVSGLCTIDTENLLSETVLKDVSFRNNFTLDLIESKKGDLSFIVKSDNPYCRINNLNGIVISPEDCKSIRKRLDRPWCLVIGVGPSLTSVNGKACAYPSLQLTFGRKILSF